MSTESQTIESAHPMHESESDFFRAHSLLDPALAVGDIDNIEFRSDEFFENVDGGNSATINNY